jgi:hypothetical protein
VFNYDWSRVACPSPDEFATAVRELPSNGLPSARSSGMESDAPGG